MVEGLPRPRKKWAMASTTAKMSTMLMAAPNTCTARPMPHKISKIIAIANNILVSFQLSSTFPLSGCENLRHDLLLLGHQPGGFQSRNVKEKQGKNEKK